MLFMMEKRTGIKTLADLKRIQEEVSSCTACVTRLKSRVTCTGEGGDGYLWHCFRSQGGYGVPCLELDKGVLTRW